MNERTFYTVTEAVTFAAQLREQGRNPHIKTTGQSWLTTLFTVSY